MSLTGVVYSPIYKRHLEDISHPESPRRLDLIMRFLKARKILDHPRIKLITPRRASIEEVRLVHEEKYIKFIERLSSSGGGYIDGDTPVSKWSFEAAMHAVGGCLKACDLIVKSELRNAFAIVRPPGHHAGSSGRALNAPTQGFCIFNNAAISAKYLIEKGVKRVLIFDFDCHHGNGTQEIFEDSPNVLYMSVHQDPYTIYPGTGFIHEIGEGEGLGFNINIPLPPGSGDDVYQEALNEILLPVTNQFKPEFIIVSAGYDAHRSDPLTSMNLSLNGFRLISDELVELSKLCNERILFILEGGYGEGLAKGVYESIKALAKIREEKWEEETKSRGEVINEARNVIKKLKKFIQPFWRL